jgi:CRP-like cAMP-binding protein
VKTDIPIPSSDEGEQLVSELARSFNEALRGTLAPLREQLAEIEQSIAERETELRELRALRTSAQRLVAFADPQRAKPKKASKPGRATAAPETVAAIASFLREHYPNGDAFTARTVSDRPDFTVASRATVTNALAELADQGVVRLDHIGDHGARNYKLVTP